MITVETPILECRNLRVRYPDGSVGVFDVSIRVGDGEIVALLGPNGAGKSTTLRALSGLLPAERVKLETGSVRFRGRDVGSWRPHQAVAQGVVLIAEREKVFGDLTVEENLRAVRPGRERRDRANESRVFELFPALAARRSSKAAMLSGGERQMLAIGRAIMLGPRVLLADEMSLGVSPAVASRLMKVLSELREEDGISVLLVEQEATAALAIADRALVLERGRVTLGGRPDDLLSDGGFVDRYLGLEERDV